MVEHSSLRSQFGRGVGRKKGHSKKCALQPPADLKVTGLYCQQCEKCMRQCPANLEIPTLMRSYMYAYSYRNPGEASAQK